MKTKIQNLLKRSEWNRGTDTFLLKTILFIRFRKRFLCNICFWITKNRSQIGPTVCSEHLLEAIFFKRTNQRLHLLREPNGADGCCIHASVVSFKIVWEARDYVLNSFCLISGFNCRIGFKFGRYIGGVTIINTNCPKMLPNRLIIVGVRSLLSRFWEFYYFFRYMSQKNSFNITFLHTLK